MERFSPELARLELRTPTLPPATHTNCYFLGDQRLTIVEPASPWEEEQALLESTLETLPGTIERIFLTHHHRDHVGGVEVLRRRFNCPVVAHARTADLLTGHVDVDETLEEGDVLLTDQGAWNVFHTPGHASGHLCLANPRTGDFLVGDMVAGEGTIVLDPPDANLQDYLDSLQRLRDASPGVLHPAHGDPIQDADGKLAEYIDHRHMRTGQVRETLAGVGRATPMELVPPIYPERPAGFQPVAARQVLCHLQWLAKRDEVREVDGAWEMA